MTKHTPGPWLYESGDWLNDPDGTRHVDISWGAPDGSPSRFVTVPKGDTSLADAHLISAAPELLAALKSLIAAWDSISPNDSVPEELNANPELWEDARTAIAKAELD